MADVRPEVESFEEAVNQYVEMCRHGEPSSIDEQLAKHPESADSIHELLPVVGLLERARRRREKSAGAQLLRTVRQPERLGDFRIVRELGRGGMGVVFEAVQESLDRRVAIKVMPRGPFLDDRRMQRFHREAQTAARLHHTNIVPVFGVGQQKDYQYYVMQMIDGVGLDDIVAELRRIVKPHAKGDAKGPPRALETRATRLARAMIGGHLHNLEAMDESSPSEETLSAAYWRCVADFGRQAADALAYAHEERTLHRDIKPGNLIIDLHGRLWIADFGLARILEDSKISHSGDLVGTLRYMAPERFSGHADAPSDIYSLGLTLYELLALQPAHQSENRTELVGKIAQGGVTPPRKIQPAVPRDLETIVLKAIGHDPDSRYGSASAMVADLDRFLEDRPILARRTSSLEKLWRWARRNPAMAALAGTSLVLVLMVAIVSMRAFLVTKQANIEVREALNKSEMQRHRATRVAEVSLDALDEIFAQLAPERVEPSKKLVIKDLTARRRVSFIFCEHTAELLEKMLAFYDRLADEVGEDIETIGRRTEAERRLGFVRFMMGMYPQAETAYSHAAELHGFLLRELPPHPKWHLAFAQTANELGDVYWAMGRPMRALDNYREAIACLDAMPIEFRDLPEASLASAASYYRLRKRPVSTRIPTWLIMRYRDRADAIAWAGDDVALKKATETMRKLLEEDPEDPRYRYMLALYLREEDRDLRPHSQLTQNEQQAVAILEALSRQFPDVTEYRYQLGLTYADVNAFVPDLTSDQLQIVEQRLRLAEELLAEVVKEHPNILEYVESMTSTYHKLGEFLKLHDLPGRRTRLLCAEQCAIALEQRYPEVREYQAWRASIQISMAEVDRRRHFLPEQMGINRFRPAIATLEKLVADEVQCPAFDLPKMLRQAKQDLCETTRELRELEAAEASFPSEQ